MDTIELLFAYFLEGNVKQRLRSSKWNEKTSSYEKNWETAFKEALKRKEEEKKRENLLKNLVPSGEMEDIKEKLKALGNHFFTTSEASLT
jgi:hypothetical protein